MAISPMAAFLIHFSSRLNKKENITLLPDIGNDTSDLEYLGITVLFKDRTITIKNIYYPPNSQHLDTNRMEDLIKPLIAQRTELLKVISQNGGLDKKIELNKLNAEIKKIYVQVKRSNWQNLCEKLDYRTSNTKLWKLAKQIDNLKPSNEETNAIISDNGHVSVDVQEAAEALAQHYANESRLGFSSYDKYFARVTRNQVKSCRDRPADNPLFNVDFTLPELSYALQNLDTIKSPGPDSIPGHFLSHLGILGRERLIHM
ncbi:RNase H domain-containing protein [Trichonephila clavipes]|nr:RNase H domain-containing protein [Trichonephila clavipes]